ncbi:hypothetical protein DDQ50_05575 [Amnibacterium flavum]|uniref:DUF7847 domain-containing protein n=1 Tax=Amnibacterium flavum TaxID=2173173 RepID=A0A2V1HVW9_9MICO|nr:hypothetical protein DDQ50_05575 [Amnibacterium flavum]
MVPGAVPPVAPPPGAWTPPPKPGLVPLRPLGFGTLLGAPFRVLRHSRAIVGLALLLQFAVVIVGGGLLAAVIFGGLSRITDFQDPDQAPLVIGTISGGILGTLVVGLFNLIVTSTLQGFVVVDVAGAVLGRRSTLRELWRRVRSYIVPLVGWSIVVFVAAGIAIAILVGIIAVGSLGSSDALVVTIPIAVALGLGFVVLGVWVSVRLSVLPSALVLERLSLGGAIARSWRLTHGHFWRTFGVQALITVIISVASQIVATPLSFLPLLGYVIDPNGQGAAVVITVLSSILSVVVSLVVGTISSIVISAAVALIYIDLRMRKEGLDLVLQAHVEEPVEGVDPYAPGAA